MGGFSRGAQWNPRKVEIEGRDWGRSLLAHKHGDLTWESQHYCEKPNVMSYNGDPSMGETTVGPGGWLAETR